MRLTTKSQVTIPQSVRRRLGIGPGSEVEFHVTRKARVAELRPVQRKPGRRPIDLWIQRARGTANSGMTTDEIMALTRGED